MKNIKKFGDYITESTDTTKTLYRLTGQKIDAENPGKWYVETEEELDPSLLTNESAPAIPVKAKHWDKKGKSKDKVAIYFHDDLDGIYSAIVMKGWLEKKGFKVTKYGIVNYQEGWITTELDPEYINIALDYAENVEGIDVYMDHHGSFEEGENKGEKAVKTETGSAYEGICDQLGIPVDYNILSVIDMIDSAKYDDYKVDIKGILDFDTSKFKNKLEFAASFNQMLKRSDHKTFIEVVANSKDMTPSIYRIYSLFKKFYPKNNIDRRAIKKVFELPWNEVDDKIAELMETPEGMQQLQEFMKDFVLDAKDRLRQMQSRTRAEVRQFDANTLSDKAAVRDRGERKIYIESQKQFKELYETKSKLGKPKMAVPGYQIMGQMVFVPSGTWANALRARAILERDLENADYIPTINYIIQKESPLYDKLKEMDGEEVELVGDIKGKVGEDQDFIPKEDVTDNEKIEGISGRMRVKGKQVIFRAKQPIFWIMLQYGNTLQVASLHKMDKYVKKYLPKTKDGDPITNLGKYCDNLTENMVKYFGYDMNANPEKTTKSGGHAGIGSVSNIFGKVNDNIVKNAYTKKYEGVRFLDLFKNKMIQDLSGIPWPDIVMSWNDPDERTIKVSPSMINKKTMFEEDIRKELPQDDPIRIKEAEEEREYRKKIKELEGSYESKIKNFKRFVNENYKFSDVDPESVILGGIDKSDYPDFVDAYIISANYSDGTTLTDEELEQFQEQNPELIQQIAAENYSVDRN